MPKKKLAAKAATQNKPAAKVASNPRFDTAKVAYYKKLVVKAGK